MTITEFLLARIEEDERAATRIVDCTETHPMATIPLPPGISVSCGVAHYRVDKRVQAECEAMRRIVEQARAYRPESEYGDTEGWALVDVVRILAAIWADHPDYDAAWAV